MAVLSENELMGSDQGKARRRYTSTFSCRSLTAPQATWAPRSNLHNLGSWLTPPQAASAPCSNLLDLGSSETPQQAAESDGTITHRILRGFSPSGR